MISFTTVAYVVLVTPQSSSRCDRKCQEVILFFAGKIVRTRRARGGTPLRNGAILCFIRDSIFYPAVSSSRNEHNRKLCATDVLPGKNAACPKYFRCCVKLAPALAKKVWWLMEYASKHVQVCAFLWNVKMLQTAGFCCELLDGGKTSFFFRYAAVHTSWRLWWLQRLQVPTVTASEQIKLSFLDAQVRLVPEARDWLLLKNINFLLWQMMVWEFPSVDRDYANQLQ